jgi:hypothetical protein
MIAAEARSGLAPWARADLPVPPSPTGLAWLGVVGPGVIVLGLSIGSGEFLLGPAVFLRHGLSLLWITAAAVTLQTIFNMEVMRYTLATGEPVFTGFMRTRPSSTMWACIYAGFCLLQYGWPAFAAVAAGAFLTCVLVLSVGKRIVRTLEVLNWILIVTILGSFLVLAIAYVPAFTWLEGAAGVTGFDLAAGRFNFIPTGVDFVLLGALVAYSGAGGCANLVLSNWARDKGYGMGKRVGYIPAAAGDRVQLAATGFTFAADADAMRRWRGWWRIIRADQWGVFFTGAVLGMLLPAMLYLTFLPGGIDIQGLGISAALASSVGGRAGGLVGGAIAFLGAWILFKTQLDNFEGMVRIITDILWTGSARVRRWRGGDVRAVYYTIMAVLVVWGLIAIRLAQPMVLLKLGANVAGGVLMVASLHLLYINTRLLPAHVRPPLWRRAALVGVAVFYGFFVALSVRAASGG